MSKYSTVYVFFHAKNIIQDNVLRIPADGSAFRCIEEKWPIFKEEPRNVKLSLAVDGVNPFGELHSTYSVWPIFFINNNLPPWMPVKRENTMLAMIFPGI